MNRLRERIKLFQHEQRIMTAALDDLREEVECMYDVKKELEDMVGDQGYNVDKAVALVNENESILNKMKVRITHG